MPRDELTQIIRFAVTGVNLAAFYVVSYVILVGFGLPLALANVISFTSAVVIQYIVQTFWTFRRPVRNAAQGLRFLATVGIGLVYSTTVSSVLAPHFGWPAWLAASIVAVTLPGLNYLSFRFWVYSPANLSEHK
jgi:putative flippase GtrA